MTPPEAQPADRCSQIDGPDMEATLHGRPTTCELVMAARDFLADEVLPVTEGRVQFHSRVAIRVLDIVTRQLERGRAQAVDHAERLASLGYGTDQNLVDAIRAGDHDATITDLAAALTPDVRAKLEVADPRYVD